MNKVGKGIVSAISAVFYLTPRAICRTFIDRPKALVFVPLPIAIVFLLGSGADLNWWGEDLAQAWQEQARARSDLSRTKQALVALLPQEPTPPSDSTPKKRREQARQTYEAAYRAWVETWNARIDDREAQEELLPSMWSPFGPLGAGFWAERPLLWRGVYHAHHFFFGTLYLYLAVAYVWWVGYLPGWKASRRRWRGAWKDANSQDSDDRVLLGIDAELKPRLLPVSERRGHVLLAGAAGTGKTELVRHLIAADMRRQAGLLIVDTRGDRAFARAVLAACHMAGRAKDFLFCTLKDAVSLSYNPLAWAHLQSRRGLWKTSRVFTTPRPRWTSSTERPGMEPLMRALVRPGHVLAFDDLYQPLLSREALALASKLATPEDQAALAAVLADYDRFQADTRELLRRIEPLVSSELRDRFSVAHADIDLASALANKRVVYFELKTALWPEVAPYLAGLVLEDLEGLLAELGESGAQRPFFVVVDDPAQIPRVNFGSLLGEASKVGIGVTLVTQHLSALDAPEIDGSGRDLTAILQNTTTKILFRQQDRKEAELASQLGQLKSVVSEWDLYGLPRGAAFVVDAQGPPAKVTLRAPRGEVKGKFAPQIPRLYAEGEREAMHRTPALSLGRLLAEAKRKAALAKTAGDAGQEEALGTGDDAENTRGALPEGEPQAQVPQLAGPSPLDPQRLLAEAGPPPERPEPQALPPAKKRRIVRRPPHKRRAGRE